MQHHNINEHDTIEVYKNRHNQIYRITELIDGVPRISIEIRTILHYTPANIDCIVNKNTRITKQFNINGIVTSIFQIHNNKMHGEYRKYSPNGSIEIQMYYNNGVDITDEINTLICDGVIDCDLRFNLTLKYGLHFQFYDDFDKVLKLKHHDYIMDNITNTIRILK